MRWYNKYIFKFIGNRRLLTEDEFRRAMNAQFGNGKLRIILARQHELLLDISANADVLTRKLDHSVVRPFEDEVVAKLINDIRTGLMTYKIVDDDHRTPPSTSAREEVQLMEIPE